MLQLVLNAIGARAPRQLQHRPTTATRTIAVSLDIVASVLADTDNHPLWVPFLVESRCLETASMLERVIYQRFRLPLPMSDRDFVFRIKAIPDRKNKTLLCRVQSETSHDSPCQANTLRGLVLESSFSLIESAPNLTRLEMNYAIDPDGVIPARLCSRFNRYWSHFFLRRLAGEIASRYPHPQ